MKSPSPGLLLAITHPIETARWFPYRHPLLLTFSAWLLCAMLVQGWTRGAYALGCIVLVLLGRGFLRWRKHRVGLYRQLGLRPRRLPFLVGRYLLEAVTVLAVHQAWNKALTSLKLTGDGDLVPRLNHLRGDLNNDLTGYSSPGAVGADVEKLSHAASKLAGYVRLGCKDVSVNPTGPGNCRVRLSFSTAFDKILTLDKLPRSPKGTLAYGIRRDGSPAWIWSHMSAIFGGLTRKGKSVLAKALIAAAIRDRLWLDLYIADTKRGIELNEFSREIGNRHGTTVRVVQYETTPKGAEQMVKSMQAEMDRRADYMKAHGLKQHVPTEDQPQLVGIFDETLPLHEMLKLGTKSPAGEIGFAGAAMCISLWICTQVAHAGIIGALRELIPQRISFATPTWQVTETILGTGAWTEGGAACHQLGNTPGVGWSSAEDEAKPQQFRSANVTPEESRGIAKGVVPADLLAPPAAGPVAKVKARVEDFVLYVAWDDSPEWRAAFGSRPAYVGISNDWKRRRREHELRDWKWCPLHRREENYWQFHARRVDVETIGTVTRKVAERHEKGQIHRRRPVFNHMHNRSRHASSLLPSFPRRTAPRTRRSWSRPAWLRLPALQRRTRPLKAVQVPKVVRVTVPAAQPDAHRLEHFDGAWSE